MITYLNHIRDTRTQRCDAATWHKLTTSEQTAMYINKFRQTKDIDWKQRLAAVNFQGYDPATLNGAQGSRKQDALEPTGLFMLDIDHLSAMKRALTPSQAYNSLLTVLPKMGFDLQKDVALVHTTPSGDGLRIVMKGRKGSTIHEDQKWLAEAMGVEYDECTKDLSRWSFVPAFSDIFYQNNDLLFGAPIEETYDKKLLFGSADWTSATNRGNVGKKAIADSLADGGRRNVTQGNLFDDSEFESADGGVENPSFPLEYKGVPYSRISQRYINYTGKPIEGERHALMVQMALDFRNICDNNVDWLLQVIPTMGKTRAELKAICQWAVMQSPKPLSKRMKSVLGDVGRFVEEPAEEPEENEAEAEETAVNACPPMPERLPRLVSLLTSKVMPFQRPAVAMMCFPALQTHVSNAFFVGLDRKKFRLSGMCVLAAKQSSGKGCVDDPIEEIMKSIIQEDKASRERERAWAESQQNKKANEKGAERPKVVIRYLNSDTTPAALLQRLYAAEHYGTSPHQFTFTKVEEIDYLYAMAPNTGKSKVSQLIRSCWDCARIGSERFTSNAANFDTELAWNWTACGTFDNVKRFFRSCTSNGTLSRVDFCTLFPPEEDFDFRYGEYDIQWRDELAPYIANLQSFMCKRDADDAILPFHVDDIDEIEEQMNAYIKQYSKKLEDDTWKAFAWRAKVSAIKKALTLYIANGQKWEAEIADFAWWSFHYSMWCKMNLFYETASEAFKDETIEPVKNVASVLDWLPMMFTRSDFYVAMKRNGFKTRPSTLLNRFVKNGVVNKLDGETFSRT